MGESVNSVDNKTNINSENVKKQPQCKEEECNGIVNKSLSSSSSFSSKKETNNSNFGAVNISKSVSEIVITEDTDTFSKLLITKQASNCNNLSESESSDSSQTIKNNGEVKSNSAKSDNLTPTTSKENCSSDQDDDSAKENIDGDNSASSSPSKETKAETVNKIEEDSCTSFQSKSSKKKGSKNRWRPLEIEPPFKPEDRQRGRHVSRKKDLPPINSETNGSKKFGEPQNRANGGNDKGFRGSRRGRGRGRGPGGARGRNRNYDSGRININPNLHDDYPTDIAYYVDFSPITEATVTSESDVGSGIISPTLGPPPAAAFVPGVIPTTTAFVPASYFSPFSQVDSDTLRKCIKSQIEYYFSEENLQRDFFLRRKMDREGYLPISLIASFHRVQALTQDIDLVIDSVQTSTKIELNETCSKMRTTQDPLKWPIFDQRFTTQ